VSRPHPVPVPRDHVHHNQRPVAPQARPDLRDQALQFQYVVQRGVTEDHVERPSFQRRHIQIRLLESQVQPFRDSRFLAQPSALPFMSIHNLGRPCLLAITISTSSHPTQARASERPPAASEPRPHAL
jgi:hypothetical protein